MDKKKRDEAIASALGMFGSVPSNLAKTVLGKAGEVTPKPIEQNTGFGYQPYQQSGSLNEAEALKNAYASGYQMSDAVKGYQNDYNAMKANRPADWTGGQYGQQLNDLVGQIMDRQPFKYDLNADMLYQQYKDQYINNGRMAMMDTMGQASALTGGYGNSYASTAGNQAYQGYLNQLNDKIPELYQLAMEQYDRSGNDMYNKANLYNSLNQQEYGQWVDRMNQYNTDVRNAYDVYSGERANEQDMFLNNRAYATDNYNNAYDREYGQYIDDRNLSYDDYINGIKNAQWQKTFDEEVRQADMDEALNRAKLDQSQSQFEANMSEEQRQFDASMAEDRRQFDKNYNFNLRKLAESTAGVSSSGNDTKGSEKTDGMSINPEDSKAAQTIRESIGTQEQFNIETTGNSQGSGTRRAYEYNGREYTNFKEYATQYVIDAYNAGYIDDNELAYLLNHYGVQFEFKK